MAYLVFLHTQKVKSLVVFHAKKSEFMKYSNMKVHRMKLRLFEPFEECTAIIKCSNAACITLTHRPWLKFLWFFRINF